MEAYRVRWHVLLWIFLAILALVVFTYALSNSFYGMPEIQMGGAIVLSVGTLALLLFIVASGFKALNLADKDQALGLPQGSVRALIALFLIVIFAVFSLYVYRTTATGNTRFLRGVSLEEKNAVLSHLTPLQVTDVGEGKFDVLFQEKVSEDGIKLAQQLVTGVLTLVTAVASFYFGSRAAETPQTGAAEPALRIFPNSPAELSPAKGKALVVKVETTPKGEALSWEQPDGDTVGSSLVQKSPDEFEYVRGEAPNETVTLRFSLRRYPDVSKELEVKKPAQP